MVAGAGIRPFEIGDHHCFGCGSLNEHGLQMVLHVEPGVAWSVLTLEPAFEGWAGIAHGGILSTVLDEVMAWSLLGDGNWGLTARLAVTFRRPVPVARAIRADGCVTRTRRRVVETTGLINDAVSGETLAEATGLYVAADPARRAELQTRYRFRYTDPDGDAGSAHRRPAAPAVPAGSAP